MTIIAMVGFVLIAGTFLFINWNDLDYIGKATGALLTFVSLMFPLNYIKSCKPND